MWDCSAHIHFGSLFSAAILDKRVKRKDDVLRAAMRVHLFLLLLKMLSQGTQEKWVASRSALLPCCSQCRSDLLLVAIGHAVQRAPGVWISLLRVGRC